MKRTIIFALIAGMTGMQALAGSASAIGQVSARVVASLLIGSTAPMNFPNSTSGDGELTIDPADNTAAKFQVRGEPNTAYQISLPSEIVLSTGGGGDPKKEIKIKGFKSIPATVGALDSQGGQILSVGATRAPLAVDQAEGKYTGTYTVSIVY